MAVNMRENGATTKCTAVEPSNGPTAESTLESTQMTKSKATESSSGLMVAHTKVIGSTGNNMEKECTLQAKVSKSMENGKKVKESDGLAEAKESSENIN